LGQYSKFALWLKLFFMIYFLGHRAQFLTIFTIIFAQKIFGLKPNAISLTAWGWRINQKLFCPKPAPLAKGLGP
jgi:hypothetical protein